MDSDFLNRARELRAEAWDELKATAAYNAFKAFDDAVVRMGGASHSASQDEVSPLHESARRIVENAANRIAETRKLPQGDAAEIALVESREPLPLGRLMELALEKGAEIGGSDPLNNFRSTVSKDKRFRPIRRNNMHFWWLVSEPTPDPWKEAPGPDLLAETGASSFEGSRKEVVASTEQQSN